MSEKTVSAYLLNDGDDWFIHITGYYSDSTLHVDGEPAKIAPASEGSNYDRWWMVDHKPKRMEMVGKPTKRTVAYRLPEGTVIEGFEREMTAAEWRARFWDSDEYEYSDARGKLYEQIEEDVPPKVDPLDVPVLVLEGQPDPLKGWGWTATLPSALRYRTEYLHLFPGFLSGFREAAKKRLEALPDLAINFYTHNSTPSIFVTAKGEKRSGYLYTNDHYPCPDRIEGANKAAAISAWREKLDAIEADVREKSTVCPHCDGTGIEPGRLAAQRAATAAKSRGGRRRGR